MNAIQAARSSVTLDQSSEMSICILLNRFTNVNEREKKKAHGKSVFETYKSIYIQNQLMNLKK